MSFTSLNCKITPKIHPVFTRNEMTQSLLSCSILHLTPPNTKPLKPSGFKLLHFFSPWRRGGELAHINLRKSSKGQFVANAACIIVSAIWWNMIQEIAIDILRWNESNHQTFWSIRKKNLPEKTNSPHLKCMGFQVRKLLFQGSIFRGYIRFREGNQKTHWGCQLSQSYNNWGLKRDVGEFPFTTLSPHGSSLSRPFSLWKSWEVIFAIGQGNSQISLRFVWFSRWKKNGWNLVGVFFGALNLKPPLIRINNGDFSLQEVTVQGIWLCSFPPFKSFNLENNSQKIPITVDPWGRTVYLPTLIP